MRYWSLLLVALATAWAGSAQAERVGGSVAPCHQAPSARSRLVARLSPGTPVRATEHRASWTRVAARGRACWVASRLLVADGGSAARVGLLGHATVPRERIGSARHAAAYHALRLRHSAKASPGRHRGARTTHGRGARAAAYGGSCPCGSGHICIGPRGGRYCITRGGYKEYGQ